MIAAEAWQTVLNLLHPFAPFVTEELWEQMGNRDLLIQQSWPAYGADRLEEPTMTLPIQINGKIRAQVVLARNVDENVLRSTVLDMPQVKKWIHGKTIQKWVYVPNRLVSIVV